METIVDLDSDVRLLFSVSRYLQVKQGLFTLLSAENADNQSDFALGKCRFISIPYSILKFHIRVHFLSLPIEGRGYWKYQDNVGLILPFWSKLKIYFTFMNMDWLWQYGNPIFCLCTLSRPCRLWGSPLPFQSPQAVKLRSHTKKWPLLKHGKGHQVRLARDGVFVSQSPRVSAWSQSKLATANSFASLRNVANWNHDEQFHGTIHVYWSLSSLIDDRGQL